MTIEKIESIKNLAVFQNFDWDTAFKSEKKPKKFGKINIFYGRNYSGKTTLSRIFRGMENGKLSDKYICPEFSVKFQDGIDVNQTNLKGHGKLVRVFNEDFVRENLRFISNPEDDIEPFAILGSDNVEIEKEIEIIEKEIGSSVLGQENGLEKQRVELRKKYQEIKDKLDKLKSALAEEKSDFSTNKKTGIKYNPQKFGNQNYNISKLENDIEAINSKKYTALSPEEKSEKERLISETPKETIAKINLFELNFVEYSESVRRLITSSVAETERIEQLVKDAILHKWAHQGYELHHTKFENCAFCGSFITKERWDDLEKHFDVNSEKLVKQIIDLIKKIEFERTQIEGIGELDKNLFYSKFHSKVEELNARSNKWLKDYRNNLNNLIGQLRSRQDDILSTKVFIPVNDICSEYDSINQSYEVVRCEANDYTKNMTSEQNNAKIALRLNEVAIFFKNSRIMEKNKNIEECTEAFNEISNEGISIKRKIEEKQKQLSEKKRQLNNEEKGAVKVNEYLRHYFGHKFLTLEAQNLHTDDLTQKKFKFCVMRDGKKAFHLSEGECSLLAFCYFLAKLDDVNTKGQKPIIWIDDPISSLDNNHIFFIYSLLFEELVVKDQGEQIFLSTHNLDFLKYLKRLDHSELRINPKPPKYNTEFFVIDKIGNSSQIISMPLYLKEYVTEYIFLFKKIYSCAKEENISDGNFNDFYNFGNNARKFLEIFLYYKYPERINDTERNIRFFGEGNIPVFFVNRVNNEYSHLSGGLERGALPIDVPEMKAVAELILRKISEHDNEQYQSLLRSIDDNPRVTST